MPFDHYMNTESEKLETRLWGHFSHEYSGCAGYQKAAG